MDKTESIEVENVYKAIKLVENEIAMETATLNDERVSGYSKELIAKGLEEKYRELNYLKALSEGRLFSDIPQTVFRDELEAVMCNLYKLRDHEKSYTKNTDSKTLKKGEVGYINQFTIKEPVSERMFLIRGLEEFNVTETDIISYEDDTVEQTLRIKFRNNIVDCPVVEFNERKRLYDGATNCEILIDSLDSTGVVVYTTHYTGDVRIKSLGKLTGNYASNNSQTFEVIFSYNERSMEKNYKKEERLTRREPTRSEDK